MGVALEGACAVSNIMSLGDQVLKPSNSKLHGQSRSLTIDQTNIQINVTPDNAFEEQLKNVTILSDAELISKYSECLSCFKRFSTGPLEMESHFKFIRALIYMQVGGKNYFIILKFHINFLSQFPVDILFLYFTLLF